MDIEDALAKHGFQTHPRQIILEVPLKQLGEFPVPVRLHREVTASLNVQVVQE